MNLFEFRSPDLSKFDKKRIVMREVNYQTAHKVITENHYSHCMPCCELALGFYVDPDIKYKRIPRKHRYIYLLGSRKQRKDLLKRLKYPILPYPKRAEEVSREIRTASSCERSGQFRHSALGKIK